MAKIKMTTPIVEMDGDDPLEDDQRTSAGTFY